MEPLKSGLQRKRKCMEESNFHVPLHSYKELNTGMKKEDTEKKAKLSIIGIVNENLKERSIAEKRGVSEALSDSFIVKTEETREIMKKEPVVKVELIMKEEPVMKLMVVLDGPSVGRPMKNQPAGGPLEDKLLAALNYFKLQGHDVVIFFPNHLVKKLKPVGKAVMDCVKLTMKKSCHYTNPWGLDRWEVLQFAVAKKAMLVSNDSYKDYTFESDEFLDQVTNRLSGFTWSEDGFLLTGASVKEGVYPNLNSLYWKPQAASELTDRQKQVLELEARESSLVQYETEKLNILRQMEKAEKAADL